MVSSSSGFVAGVNGDGVDRVISSSNGFVPEEGVEIIVSSSPWIPYAVMLDTVLKARELPGVISNLDASVADVDASSSTGFVAWLVSVWLVTVLEA